MSLPAKKQFDMLQFIHTSKNLGVNEELATYQAKQFSQLIDIADANTKEEFDMRELATKADVHDLRLAAKADMRELEIGLKTEISELRIEMHELGTELRTEMHEFGTELRTEMNVIEKRLSTDLHRVENHVLGLGTQIERLRFDTLKFIVWTGVAGFAFLACLVGKGFHWFG